MKVKLRAMLLLGALLVCACSQGPERVETRADYVRWLSNVDNGCIRDVKSNGLHISVAYLPAELLALREMTARDDFSDSLRRELVANYAQSIALQMEIGPDTSRGKGDIMYKDLGGYDDYAARLKTLNFRLEEYVKLRAGERQLRPALALMENIYSLRDSRRFLLLFTPPADEEALALHDDLDLLFYDEVFRSGVHSFAFRRDDLQGIPDLPFQTPRRASL